MDTTRGAMDVIKLLEGGYGWIGERVAQVRPEQLSRATPCSEWNLRELLNHMLATIEGLTEIAASESDSGRVNPAQWSQTDHIRDDLAAAFDACATRSLRVWHAPDVLERGCLMPFGPAPGAVVARFALVDAVVHGWDISRATGENADIPDELADPMLGISRELVHAGLRGGAFASETAPADGGGSASDRLVSFLGRTP
jgi:uncharacterized protein (TIGR03086 family)